jgi:putative ABC transport system ATP-binding protein
VAVRSLYVEPEPVDRPTDSPALEYHDVFKIYRSGPVETVALRGLDLRIERGELVAVLGPSGSGKSTFLHLIGVFGRSLTRLTEAERADYRARDLALVFQSDNLWPALSARENVATALRLSGSNYAHDRVDEALAQFGLAQRAKGRPSELSGGEQQRTAIAAAAARRAPLVLADEPTGELDRANEAIVLDALRDLRDEVGSTVVVVTHSPSVADAADRVIELRDGRVAA